MSSRSSHNVVALSICVTLVCAEIAAMLLVTGPAAGGPEAPATPTGLRCDTPPVPATIAPLIDDAAMSAISI